MFVTVTAKMTVEKDITIEVPDTIAEKLASRYYVSNKINLLSDDETEIVNNTIINSIGTAAICEDDITEINGISDVTTYKKEFNVYNGNNKYVGNIYLASSRFHIFVLWGKPLTEPELCSTGIVQLVDYIHDFCGDEWYISNKF